MSSLDAPKQAPRQSLWSKHKIFETNSIILVIGVLIVISIGGLVEIAPLFYLENTIEKVEGMRPYTPLELAGREIYVREGCYGCHSQMIRPFFAETLRYGHYSVAGEFVYDHPYQWGSKRTGPDLARVGGKYNDEWHRVHLINPRDVVPESNMPAYSWLEGAKIDDYPIANHMKALRRVGVPYTDAEIAGASAQLKGKTEMDAMVAYLQGLGRALR